MRGLKKGSFRVKYGVLQAESNFDPHAVSRAGAKGLTQLMPGTAKALGVSDSFHPTDNIDGGVRYLRYLLDLFGGYLQLPLAAYHAGKEAVLRYNDIPPYRETQTYDQHVRQYFKSYSSAPTVPRGS